MKRELRSNITGKVSRRFDGHVFHLGIDSEADVAATETQLAIARVQATNLGILRAQYDRVDRKA